MVSLEEIKEKILKAKAALGKHLDFLPGAIEVFGSILMNAVEGGLVPNDGMVGAIFPTVPQEDLALVVDAITAVKTYRQQLVDKDLAVK